jgi:hypothetical protein
MAWYLAEIREGIEADGWRSGHHVYVNRTVTGLVRVIGRGGLTAVVKLGEARRRLRVVRDAAGNPVAVRGQHKQEIRWEAREARRFDGRRCLAA